MSEGLSNQHELVQFALNGFARAIPLQMDVFARDESDNVIGTTLVELQVTLGVEEERLLMGYGNNGIFASIMAVLTKDRIPYARVTIPNIHQCHRYLPVIAFRGIDALAMEHSLTPSGEISYEQVNEYFHASRIYTPR